MVGIPDFKTDELIRSGGRRVVRMVQLDGTVLDQFLMQIPVRGYKKSDKVSGWWTTQVPKTIHAKSNN